MALTTTQTVRLRLWGWRRQFWAMGFDTRTALRLCFWKLWASRGVVGGKDDG